MVERLLSILGLCRDNGKKMETTITASIWLYTGYIGTMEKKMEPTIMGSIEIYRGYIGIMEKKMEASI